MSFNYEKTDIFLKNMHHSKKIINHGSQLQGVTKRKPTVLFLIAKSVPRQSPNGNQLTHAGSI